MVGGGGGGVGAYFFQKQFWLELTVYSFTVCRKQADAAISN